MITPSLSLPWANTGWAVSDGGEITEYPRLLGAPTSISPWRASAITPNVYAYRRADRVFCVEPPLTTHRGFRRSRAFWPFSSTAETVLSSAIGMLVAGRIFFFGLFSLFCPVCFPLSLSLTPLFAPPLLCSVACLSSRPVPLDFLGFGRAHRKPFCVAVWGVIAVDWK